MSAHVHLFGCKTGVPGGRGPCPGCRGCAAAEGQVVGGRNPIGAAGCSGALGGAGSAPSHQEQLWLLSPALMCIPVQGRAPGGSAHHPPLPDCQSEPWHPEGGPRLVAEAKPAFPHLPGAGDGKACAVSAFRTPPSSSPVLGDHRPPALLHVLRSQCGWSIPGCAAARGGAALPNTHSSKAAPTSSLDVGEEPTSGRAGGSTRQLLGELQTPASDGTHSECR